MLSIERRQEALFNPRQGASGGSEQGFYLTYYVSKDHSVCHVQYSGSSKGESTEMTQFPMDSTAFHLTTVDMSDGSVRILTLLFLHMLKISNIKIRKTTQEVQSIYKL